VAGALTSDDLRRLARLGAMRRLEEIRREEAAIRSAFPELFDHARPSETRRRPGRPAKSLAAPADGQGAPAERGGAKAAKRGRRKMTAAQKKAVGERMRKYWAERRKAAKA
jgi:hypothetical protein